jgi:hypothetical protein
MQRLRHYGVALFNEQRGDSSNRALFGIERQRLEGVASKCLAHVRLLTRFLGGCGDNPSAKANAAST